MRVARHAADKIAHKRLGYNLGRHMRSDELAIDVTITGCKIEHFNIRITAGVIIKSTDDLLVTLLSYVSEKHFLPLSQDARGARSAELNSNNSFMFAQFVRCLCHINHEQGRTQARRTPIVIAQRLSRHFHVTLVARLLKGGRPEQPQHVLAQAKTKVRQRIRKLFQCQPPKSDPCLFILVIYETVNSSKPPIETANCDEIGWSVSKALPSILQYLHVAYKYFLPSQLSRFNARLAHGSFGFLT
mmetsp:Transcript_81482/g.186477  ORF Transcript_81482/g.186477 Transcript_81482/m.186477 type:complete len:244 (+) Transcript_81482:1879-2610(+)